MTKNLIIGFASNYEWKDLQYWVNSIQKTSFSGDIHIVTDNMKKETIEKLVSKNVNISLYGKKNENGDFVSDQSIAPHVNRFFYIWNALKNMGPDTYRNVVTTDVRDVIFQSNPMEWLEERLVMHSLVASSEGMQYKNEPWGNNNLLEAFGPFYHNLMKDNLIYNVGVIGGDYYHVRGLLSLIFQLSINRPIRIVDQAVYNYIINTEPFVNDTMFTTNQDAWAIQLGTTLEAVRCGSGDLGQAYIRDEAARVKYLESYVDQGIIIEDGIVKDLEKQPYCIVHQYDRIHDLNMKIQQLYGDNDVSESRTIFYHSV
jgi:hypothetical protein